MINKKKLKYCLGMLCTAVITTRETQMRERRVCVCLCVSQWGVLLRLFLAKPLCGCVQYAISSGGIITLTLEYSKERLFTVVQCLDFRGLAYSNSLQYMCSRTEPI